MIRVVSKGNFKNTEKFLYKARRHNPYTILKKYAEEGLKALQEATPVNTGLTARSWSYEITKNGDVYLIAWNNSNIQNGVNIAVILDLGHGTSNGGYVQGRNYIKPAIRPIFDKIAGDAWREVTDA